MDISYLNLNLFICFSVPILFAALVLKGRIRLCLLFLFFGIETCLFCGEINSVIFNALTLGEDTFSILITPIIEEIFLALPFLIYIFIWKPKRKVVLALAILSGVGFSMQENAYILIKYAEEGSLFMTIIRAFGAGLTHVLLSLFVGYVLSKILYKENNKVLFVILTILGSILYHALFNFVVTSISEIVGFFLPIITAIPFVFFVKKDLKNLSQEDHLQ